MADKFSHTELTETNTAIDRNDSLSNWFVDNILKPATNSGPLSIYNTINQITHLPEIKLTPAKTTPYELNWFAQSLSSGTGMALPLALAAASTKIGLLKASNELCENKFTNLIKPILRNETFALSTGTAIYGFIEKPEQESNIWNRLAKASSLGLGFTFLSKANAFTRESSNLAKGTLYPLSGALAGATASEIETKISTGEWASAENLTQAAVQGITMNTVFGFAHEKLAKKTAVPELELEPEKISEIIRVSNEYAKWVKTHKYDYPLRHEFSNLSPEDIVNRGFYHPEAKNFREIAETFKDKERPLPEAEIVAREVAKMVANMPMAESKGNLIFGEWNLEFLTREKANYFKDSYKEIVPRHHLLFLEEVNEAGLAQIARDSGYKYVISEANSRGQAVGFLINNRLKILGIKQYNEITRIHNIPDLRPALRVDLLDTSSGKEFSAVVVHLKSMRGGTEETAKIRIEQANRLARLLEPDFKGIIAGDWNTFLDRSSELNSLKHAGFKILNPKDTRPTHTMGGRLDGFLFKGIEEKLSNTELRPFWRNPLITRGLSDHGLITTRWHIEKYD